MLTFASSYTINKEFQHYKVSPCVGFYLILNENISTYLCFIKLDIKGLIRSYLKGMNCLSISCLYIMSGHTAKDDMEIH